MSLHKSEKRFSAFKKEYAEAELLLATGEFERSFFHAERAHILGQPWAGPHTAAHWLMLKIGYRRGDWREIRGQVIRLSAGGLLSLIGRLPNGNTGGANVDPERPMALPADLAAICAPPSAPNA